MTNFQTVNPVYNLGTATPIYTQPMQQQAAPQMPSPAQNLTSPIYNYPNASLYGQNRNPQQVSGVNIYIYNPTGIGAGGTPSVFMDQPSAPMAQTPLQPGIVNNNIQNYNQQPGAQMQQPANTAYSVNNAQQPVASTPVADSTKTDTAAKKTKQITQLTDNYIKSLENYLKNPDSTIRQMGIKDLIKRFEEDTSRYENPALTALLNIALQDPDANNRLMAMSPIAGGSAHGDNNTMALLQRLQTSDKLYGQEAQFASEALLKTAQDMITVPDNSPDKPAAAKE